MKSTPSLPPARSVILGIFLSISLISTGQVPAPPLEGKVYFLTMGPEPGDYFELPGIDEPTRKVPRGFEGRPRLAAPPEGALPPTQLYFQATLPEDVQSDEEPPPPQSIPIRLNRSVGPRSFPIGVPLEFRIERDPSTRTAFVLPPLTHHSVMLVVIRPRGSGKTPWTEGLQAERISILSENLRGKEVLVKNYTTRPIRFLLEENQPITLAPGEWEVYDVETMEKGVRSILAAHLNEDSPFLVSSIRIPREHLSFIGFHDVDPATNRGRNTGILRAVMEHPPSPTPVPEPQP